MGQSWSVLFELNAKWYYNTVVGKYSKNQNVPSWILLAAVYWSCCSSCIFFLTLEIAVAFWKCGQNRFLACSQKPDVLYYCVWGPPTKLKWRILMKNVDSVVVWLHHAQAFALPCSRLLGDALPWSGVTPICRSQIHTAMRAKPFPQKASSDNAMVLSLDQEFPYLFLQER